MIFDVNRVRIIRNEIIISRTFISNHPESEAHMTDLGILPITIVEEKIYENH